MIYGLIYINTQFILLIQLIGSLMASSNVIQEIPQCDSSHSRAALCGGFTVVVMGQRIDFIVDKQWQVPNGF